MSDYIDREKFIKLLVNRDLREISTKTIGECLDKAEVADVVEVGKAYPRGLFEKYGLTEWKDKDGQRWVMVERQDDEKVRD